MKGVYAEWRATAGVACRLYRVTVPLELTTDARLAFDSLHHSTGTRLHGFAGDRSVDQFRLLQDLDDTHSVAWQSYKASELCFLDNLHSFLPTEPD